MPSGINKEATQRFVSSHLAENKRKLKNSVPVPQAVHLKWDKNLK